MVPGEYKLQPDKVPYNVGYDDISLKVKNVGDRPVQVGSEFHFMKLMKKDSNSTVVKLGVSTLIFQLVLLFVQKLVKSGPLS